MKNVTRILPTTKDRKERPIEFEIHGDDSVDKINDEDSNLRNICDIKCGDSINVFARNAPIPEPTGKAQKNDIII